MARPIKEGMDYFPLNVDFFDDPKVIYAEELHGVHGGYIACRLLCAIYRDGYYLKWDADASLVMAKRLGNGITSGLIDDVVKSLIKKGFFCQIKFQQHGILTSHGIQNRWRKIMSDLKRKGVINSAYEVVNSDMDELMPEETISETELSTQKKGKEKKGKENTIVHPKPGEQRGQGSIFENANTPEQGRTPGKPVEGRQVPAEWEADFKWFWEAYGKKIGRSKCERKFKNLSKAERAAIRGHVPEYVASTPEIRFRKDPLTYLNGQHWEDEIPATRQPQKDPLSKGGYDFVH